MDAPHHPKVPILKIFVLTGCYDCLSLVVCSYHKSLCLVGEAF